MRRLVMVTAVSALIVGLGFEGTATAQTLPIGDPPPEEEPPPPPPPPEPPPPPPTLRRGDANPDVAAVEQRLRDLAYDSGAVDGVFDRATQFAVFALQKVQGLPVHGEVDPPTRAALDNPVAVAPLVAGEPNRIEIDIGRQLLTAYRDGAVVLVTHISSGNNQRYCLRRRCATAITPRGRFVVSRHIRGWRRAPLGRMYNPSYFTRVGHAIHGSLSVPLYPASHGCVRIPMHTAQWFQGLVPRGTPIYIP